MLPLRWSQCRTQAHTHGGKTCARLLAGVSGPTGLSTGSYIRGSYSLERCWLGASLLFRIGKIQVVGRADSGTAAERDDAQRQKNIIL
jgi:hypothetical protein